MPDDVTTDGPAGTGAGAVRRGATEALVLVGHGRYQDPWHDDAATAQQVGLVLEASGVTPRVRGTFPGALDGLDPDGVALLVVIAGRGRTDPAFDSDDAAWAAFHRRLADLVEAGVPLLAVHQAANTFGDSPEWVRLLGGRWVDGTSSHPPIGDAVFDVVDPDHPLTSGLGPVRAFDERYCHLEVDPASRVLLSTRHDGRDHPVVWVAPGPGRVVYDGLGHDVRSYAGDPRRDLLRREIGWLLSGADAGGSGAPAADVVGLREDYAPWSFWELAPPGLRRDQHAYQDELRARGFGVGEGCVVSRLAAVHPESLTLGDRTTVAAHAHLSGDLRFGADCTVNVGTAVRGRVRGGDGVRIGSHTSLLGFDHGFADTTVPIWTQPHTSIGITVGDDVWIGSHAVVLDGVHVGAHAVVGAGAVVIRDVPEWAVVVGNPARVVRDRRGPGSASAPGSAPGSASRSDPAPVPVPASAAEDAGALADRLRAFGARAREQAPDVLARSFDERAGVWVDRPGRPATVRAHCDAVEVGDLLAGGPPGPWSRGEHVARLQGYQSRSAGLVPELGPDAGPVDPSTPLAFLGDGAAAYHVLSVGYALALLGSDWAVPPSFAATVDPAVVVAGLDALDLERDAWGAGHRVDGLGTALTWELASGRPVSRGVPEALLGWLLAHRDPATGLWGRPGPDGLRLPVNGFYRTVRGTFAQWGVELPDHRTVIDAVLRHAADPRVFGPGRASACDVLDILHPLWWLTRRDRGHRWSEIQDVAREHATRITDRWATAGGFAFMTTATPGPDDAADVGLQGTEMWLATLWYAADLLDLSGELGYRPRGVHRPEPLLDLGRVLGVARRAGREAAR